MTLRRRITLILTFADNNSSQLPLAVQVRDNSAARISENAHAMKEAGLKLR